MMNLTLKEQEAMLQCLWQVLAANPTQFENNYVQTQLVNGWGCLSNVDMSDAPMLRFQLGCEVKPWVMVAIMQEPYEAFAIVRTMNSEKKQFIKQLVLKLIENGGKYNVRAPYAHTLFENCKIPFIVKGDLFQDGHFGNRIV